MIFVQFSSYFSQAENLGYNGVKCPITVALQYTVQNKTARQMRKTRGKEGICTAETTNAQQIRKVLSREGKMLGGARVCKSVERCICGLP